MVITNAVVHGMDRPVILRGYVAVEGDKILSVGPMEDLPAAVDGDRIDAAGGHVYPGLVDAHCHIGLFGDSLGFEGEDGNESTDPCTPQLRGLDGINPQDRCFQEAREAGVTCVLTGPGSANPIAGQFAAIKTAGRWVDEMVVAAPVSMKFALGENPKQVYHGRKESPVTRMATASLIRETLNRAREYMDKRERAGGTDYDPKLEALLPVLRGELSVHCHAHRADDIATAVRLSKEFGFRLAVVHGTEGYRISELLSEEKIPVITGPILSDRSKPELAGLTVENPALLAKAGVRIAICTDHPVIPCQYLPLCAAFAVRAGMEAEDALAAVTIQAAAIAGIDRRVGSLTAGKDADLVLSTGAPLDFTSQVKAVFIGGRRVK